MIFPFLQLITLVLGFICQEGRQENIAKSRPAVCVTRANVGASVLSCGQVIQQKGSLLNSVFISAPQLVWRLTPAPLTHLLTLKATWFAKFHLLDTAAINIPRNNQSALFLFECTAGFVPPFNMRNNCAVSVVMYFCQCYLAEFLLGCTSLPQQHLGHMHYSDLRHTGIYQSLLMLQKERLRTWNLPTSWPVVCPVPSFTFPLIWSTSNSFASNTLLWHVTEMGGTGEPCKRTHTNALVLWQWT